MMLIILQGPRKFLETNSGSQNVLRFLMGLRLPTLYVINLNTDFLQHLSDPVYHTVQCSFNNTMIEVIM